MAFASAGVMLRFAEDEDDPEGEQPAKNPTTLISAIPIGLPKIFIISSFRGGRGHLTS
jgi:hypothetical protein